MNNSFWITNSCGLVLWHSPIHTTVSPQRACVWGNAGRTVTYSMSWHYEYINPTYIRQHWSWTLQFLIEMTKHDSSGSVWGWWGWIQWWQWRCFSNRIQWWRYVKAAVLGCALLSHLNLDFRSLIWMKNWSSYEPVNAKISGYKCYCNPCSLG